jgi:LAO/AO transport system kinase
MLLPLPDVGSPEQSVAVKFVCTEVCCLIHDRFGGLFGAMDVKMGLAERIRAGEKRAAARLISLLEAKDEAAAAEMDVLYQYGGSAHVIGVTGAPGSGKSSLIAALAREYRRRGETIGILAIDPSSPLTGGALLGDRVRMSDLTGDPGIFIRSMASRGALGGLSAATLDTLVVLDALGCKRILIETVGTGQSEVEIAYVAESIVVVNTPGMGDDIQALKAGILEIADILVLNKADIDGVDRAEAALMEMLTLGHQRSSWAPVVLKTVATEGVGIKELVAALDKHREQMISSGEVGSRYRDAARHEMLKEVQSQLLDAFVSVVGEDAIDGAIRGLSNRRSSPKVATTRLLAQFWSSARRNGASGKCSPVE